MQNKEKSKIGVVHGRFQILHNDHLKYILAAKERCRELVIAITNPDPQLTLEEADDVHRSSPLANPLTYFERYKLVKTAMHSAGQDFDSFYIVPFPISMPERYRFYVPMDAVFFLSIYDDWGRRKQHYFKSLGLKLDILWDIPLKDKGISGTHVRKLMIDNGSWEPLVPVEVAALLKKWQIPERLRQINSSIVKPG